MFRDFRVGVLGPVQVASVDAPTLKSETTRPFVVQHIGECRAGVRWTCMSESAPQAGEYPSRVESVHE
jgi:hypothetical protein